MAVRLNRRLVLEERIRQPDGAGGFTGGWAVLGTIWGEITSRAGRDRGDEGVRTFELRQRIVVRGAAPGAPSRPRVGQRLREGDRAYSILSVEAFDPAGHFLKLTTREEVAG